VGQVVGLDALALVGHREPDLSALRVEAGPDADGPGLVVQGFAGILENVDDDLLDLLEIAPEMRNAEPVPDLQWFVAFCSWLSSSSAAALRTRLCR
jgi:hypothetical protein